MLLKRYKPHEGQLAFHWGIQNTYRFMLMLCGIRGGKTYAGAREATKQCWNSNIDINIPFGIIAPTYHMLDRTTWREFKSAAKPLILKNNDTKKIITLKNGREVFGFSADAYDRIRNVTLMGAWIDEARECRGFAGLWDVILGRLLSTNGKAFVTSSPNSFDDMHDIFIEQGHEDYGVVRFTTYENTTISKKAIDNLSEKYDKKFADQELLGKIVSFEGAVYYTFDRRYNAGDLAFKVAKYDSSKPIALCCDFNIDPMAWVIVQLGKNAQSGLEEIYVVDEIYLGNSNTEYACKEFKNRYPDHRTGIVLYGDATGRARSTTSNVTNWMIIEEELRHYGITKKIRSSNPAERDRVNSVNGMMCNSKGDRRILVNPNCKNVIRDLEQVSYKEGSSQIDKTKDKRLTHVSDAFGYMIEREYSLNKDRFTGLKI